MNKSLTIREVAKILRKNEQFVRIGLQQGILPIGYALKMPGKNKYTYHISKKLLEEYIGAI